MHVAAVRLIQTLLKELGHYDAIVDGDRGPRTAKAVRAALLEREADLPTGWRDWSEKRQAIAFLQLTCHDREIDSGSIDGWWGPQTDYAYEALAEVRATGNPPRQWRDERPLDANPNAWPKQSNVTDSFGPHGEAGGHCPPLRQVECPWTLKIAWNRNQTTSRISIHENCADSLGRVLARVHERYGNAEIERLGLDLFGGCYNPRKMRGSDRWSMHSWGIALDWDPANNRLKWGRDQATLAHRDYLDWWRCWEEEGWVSLGRTRNFDWMHVQAAKL